MLMSYCTGRLAPLAEISIRYLNLFLKKTEAENILKDAKMPHQV